MIKSNIQGLRCSNLQNYNYILWLCIVGITHVCIAYKIYAAEN